MSPSVAKTPKKWETTEKIILIDIKVKTKIKTKVIKSNQLKLNQFSLNNFTNSNNNNKK